ncbi:MAG: CpsB/CapC family capsule biosynthesis tyrosine phosphatase [Thermodesulfobacteriota bacterium]|nr:CpsB/CapC family capsule biosynthesis tyrosine phosphatase [Thermodesulfobacteriota bacterium]
MHEYRVLALVIDLHCHILHGTDDGAETVEDSLSMAKKAVKDGIHTIVATPHTLNGVYSNSVHEVNSRVVELQDALTYEGIDLKVCPGADVHLCPRLNERIQNGDAGTVNNTGKYVLLEFPLQTIPPSVKGEIFDLKVNGITPIITHPARHPVIQHDMDLLYELVCMGALCQITAMSITGDFGEDVMRCAERLLKHRMVHVIASDAHSPEKRPPELSRAVDAAAETMGSVDEAEHMVKELPARIIAGDAVEVPDPMPQKKRLWS